MSGEVAPPTSVIMSVDYVDPSLEFIWRTINDEPNAIDIWVPLDIYLRDSDVYNDLIVRALDRDVKVRVLIDD